MWNLEHLFENLFRRWHDQVGRGVLVTDQQISSIRNRSSLGGHFAGHVVNFIVYACRVATISRWSSNLGRKSSYTEITWNPQQCCQTNYIKPIEYYHIAQLCTIQYWVVCIYEYQHVWPIEVRRAITLYAAKGVSQFLDFSTYPKHGWHALNYWLVADSFSFRWAYTLIWYSIRLEKVRPKLGS